MQFYLLVNPFTNTPMHFTTLLDSNYKLTRRVTVDNNVQIQEQNALCIPVEFDESLLSKQYDPDSNSFI